MDNTQFNQLVQALASTLGIETTTIQAVVPASAVAEQKYIIYIGKKERNVKAPYIAINADGQLSGFTEEADVYGHGTDRIGKFTLAEIEERFPQFNHPAFLIEA